MPPVHAALSERYGRCAAPPAQQPDAAHTAARGAAPLWAGFAFRIVEPLTPLKRVDAAALLAAGGGAVLGEEELFAGRRGCLAPLCVLSMQTKHWAAVGKAGALDALRSTACPTTRPSPRATIPGRT